MNLSTNELFEQSITDLAVQDEMIWEADIEDRLLVMVHEECESPLEPFNIIIEGHLVSQNDILL